MSSTRTPVESRKVSSRRSATSTPPSPSASSSAAVAGASEAMSSSPTKPTTVAVPTPLGPRLEAHRRFSSHQTTLASPSCSTPQRSASCSTSTRPQPPTCAGSVGARGRLEARARVAHRDPDRVALHVDAELHRLARVEPGVADAVGDELGDHEHDVAEDVAEVPVEPRDRVAGDLRGVRLGRQLERDEGIDPIHPARPGAYRRRLLPPIGRRRDGAPRAGRRRRRRPA